MERVSVVGSSGSGKTRLARRIADVIGAAHVELDSIYHLAGWQALDAAEFLATVTAVADTRSWVIDGNYRDVVTDGPVWRRADTVVWLDLPRRTVMRQVTVRTFRRFVRHEELWNGNRESIRNALAWDPHRSVIRWAWTQYGSYQERYGTAMRSPELSHLDFVRLTSHSAADTWLRELTSQRRPG